MLILYIELEEIYLNAVDLNSIRHSGAMPHKGISEGLSVLHCSIFNVYINR